MDGQNIFIVRCGETALKGRNKPYFEKKIAEGVRSSLKGLGAEVKRHEGLIFVRADKAADKDEIVRRITGVFGVDSVSPAAETESSLEPIGEKSVEYMLALMEKEGVKSFKVEAKRADKNFPVKSPDIGRIMGAKILAGCGGLKVDVHDPDVRLYIDVRSDKSYIYHRKFAGPGGLPSGTNGRGLVLFSGGIDSPVAAFMMAKRGMQIEAVHFHSYPYTSLRAQEKAERLAGIIASYCGGFAMYMVNLLPIQEQIVEKCPEDETTILVRRFMMRIAEKIARESNDMMLITGESLGQVASQTAEAIAVTDACVGMPVLRPLIAMDKADIMDKAAEIGTYETSIEPFEDCCTVFLPKHPVTRPKLGKILESESLLDVEKLVDEAAGSAERIYIRQK